ncbi:hypothetical protein M2271_000674 [Streptomyces sp. LBL]|nr:hypothetical protein [Streptomyces sp. LBL]
MPHPHLLRGGAASRRRPLRQRRGQVVTGTVQTIASFGVTFVDINGFTAMINIPELSWRPVQPPVRRRQRRPGEGRRIQALQRIRDEFGGGIPDALDLLNHRYIRLQQDRSEDFTTGN